MKHLFIINPAAGKGGAVDTIKPQIESYCNAHGIDYQIHVTSAPYEAIDFVREKASTGEQLRIYACGGDGTLYEVVNGAQGFDNVEIAVIPLGSGNDFIRLFGTKEHFIDVEAQINGTAVELDLIKCGDRYAINQCSMGLDAEICAKQVSFKKKKFVGGEMAYTLAAVYCLFRKCNNEFTVSFDDGPAEKVKVLFCVAANSRWYGGGFLPAPMAMPDDGKLEFIVVRKNMSRLKMLGLINQYKEGKHIGMDITTHRSGKKITIHSDSSAAVNIDGECDYANDSTFEIIEKGIRFVVPTTSDYFEKKANGTL